MATGINDWTLEELHRLPDDGNKYELLGGQLFVTPAPSELHELICVRLTRIVDRYVEANGLGYVYRPRAVVRVLPNTEVEPDLKVRLPNPTGEWERAPTATLVVEIMSPTTRRRDLVDKKRFYMKAGIHEYWVVDPERQRVTVVSGDGGERTVADVLVWQPPGVASELRIDVRSLFI